MLKRNDAIVAPENIYKYNIKYVGMHINNIITFLLQNHHNIQNSVVIQVEDDYKDCVIALNDAVEGLLAIKGKKHLSQSGNGYQDMVSSFSV
jgi:hypothetical protein